MHRPTESVFIWLHPPTATVNLILHTVDRLVRSKCTLRGPIKRVYGSPKYLAASDRGVLCIAHTFALSAVGCVWTVCKRVIPLFDHVPSIASSHASTYE